ncbi:MAG: DUF488 domain-containing protein [Acidobacteriota bacterium]
MSDTLYTIGHSTHPTEEFVRLLRGHGITAVADVRSAPYSRYNPQFRKETLAASLKAAGVAYVYLGRELGARVEDPACHVDGRVSYRKVAQTELFRSGLQRVRDGMRNYRVALMCAERDPITCHRMMLVTRNLRKEEFAIAHIRADSTLESNAEAEHRLLDAAGLPAATLFENQNALIEAAYEHVGRRMSWRPEA